MSSNPPGVISAAGNPPAPQTSVKDTVISVLISLVLAFVFRGFVLEAFQIPTGSMAPTLLGAHMRFKSPATGWDWTVAPWQYPPSDTSFDFPTPIQQSGPHNEPIVVRDPMSNDQIRPLSMPLLSGDRIFVLKYLYSIFDPARFDVVVFKNPQNPQENYIKRLIGLPNEQVALVDGDVFVRPATAGGGEASETAWAESGWTIARKPERVQRAVWQKVFGSEYTPRDSRREGRQWFVPPWKPSTQGWEMADRPSYHYSKTEPTRLDWDFERWPLVDRNPYNEANLRTSQEWPSAALLGTYWRPTYGWDGPLFYYPVSDLRVGAGFKPEADGFECALNISARGHQFQAMLGKGKITINMRPEPVASPEGQAAGAEPAWQSMATVDVGGLFEVGKVTNVEFWHVDQALEVWINGKKALFAEYNWGPAERIEHATGMTFASIVEAGHQKNRPDILLDGTKYRLPKVSISMMGSPVTLERVDLWRDLHYQATVRGGVINEPGLATSPRTVLTNGPDHFFCCGDNSPSSFDGRGWSTVNPWVATEIDPLPGIVHRNLLIGKAFFVYFPAMDHSRKLPIPDVGRMRLIW
ncbi:MAG TPA: signal peptidase I [Phycisphaerales bacterium]|nr:signal peptidase I [Phycisphaerales bacterium]